MLLLSMTTLGFAANKVIIILDASGSMWAPDRRQAEAGDRPRIAAHRAAVGAGRHRARLHGLWPSRKGQLRRHRADRAAAAGTASAITAAADSLKFLGKTPLTRRRQAGGRGAEIHRGQGDRHPHHRRARDLRRRPLRARQGARSVRRRFHRPCRRLRPDGGRGQAGRLPRRKHRRQIHPGSDDAKALAGRAGRDRRGAGAGARARARTGAQRRRPSRQSRNSTSLPTVGARRRRRSDHATAMPGRSTRPKSDGTRGDNITTEYSDYKGNLEPGDYVVVAERRRGQDRAEGQDRGRPGLQAGLRPQCRHADHPSAAQRGRAMSVDGAAVVDRLSGWRRPATYYGDTKIVLPAGDAEGHGRDRRRASVTETIPLAAGQTVEKDIIVGVGHVVANAFYAAGGDKVDGSAAWASRWSRRRRRSTAPAKT